ncbi:MAG: DUF5667 domain-containing protein [Clostridium sp.]|nr:DUF5667 domain-containing protein [Clostridium sp.]
MKKLRVFVASLVVLANISGAAFAEGSISFSDAAGITPDSILYGVDKALDSAKVALSFSDEKKVETIADVAEERLGESEVMVKEGQEDLAKTAIEEYSKDMQEANELLQGIIKDTEGEEVAPAGNEENSTTTEQSANDQNATKTTDENKVDEEDVKIDEDKNKDVKELETAIIARQQKAIEVLTAIQEKVSDNAKETIAAVIEMQTAKKEAIAQMVEKREVLTTTKQEVKDAMTKLEEAKKSGNEEAVKAAEEALKASKAKYIESKTDFKEAFKVNKVVNKETKKLNSDLVKTLHKEVKEGNITKEEAKEAIKASKTNNGNGAINKKAKDKKEEVKSEENKEVKETEETKEEVKQEKAKEEVKNAEEVKKEVKEKPEKAQQNRGNSNEAGKNRK